MERCPICRAGLNGAETCRRCRTDLSWVLALDRRSRDLTGAAMARLAGGDRVQAAALLRRARQTHRTPAVTWLLRLVAGDENPSDPG